MSLKIFRCRRCGTKVGWNDTSCPVCKRLVSNDSAKRHIIVGIIAGIAALLIAVAIVMHMI